jgi:hypothetical protein
MNDEDLYRLLEAFQRWLFTNGNSAITITNQPSGPP